MFCLQNQLFSLLLVTAFVINMSQGKLLSVNFEVYGVVQGVFFRKYTEKQAKSLNLRGWCRNTEAGTVQGLLEGESEKIAEMKKWLQYTGSPSSRIDKAVFSNEKELSKFTCDSFTIKR